MAFPAVVIAFQTGAFAADPKVITVPDPDTVSPGFIGFAVMFLLAVATILLIRSMVTHLRKVRFLPEPEDQSRSTPATRNSGTA